MDILTVIKNILLLTAPFIKQLIESKFVPMIKRKAYEKVDSKVDKLIDDLAQNASKIADEKDDLKRFSYVQGTKLGIDTIRAIANKLNKAADEIEKVL